MSEPRTVTLTTIDHGTVTLPEPDWCAGHPDTRASYKVDISHDGPEHTIAPGGREMFKALLTQAPYSSQDRAIGLYIEVANLTGTCTPDEVEELADDLIAAAVRLRELGLELAEILRRGEL
ncbi:DUF6907 domain-containing protein [Streptomyces justiciae]|uniref:DUF6907 domain-containing protein n=1 Tax=Streptomyces justiciae TaxID=2780140 RepID=UPI0018809AB8|nr:hypothetical protein [Streptomyces justiciae]MBE8471056.1 hypothetical protein [Streptomyces justiciae]